MEGFEHARGQWFRHLQNDAYTILEGLKLRLQIGGLPGEHAFLWCASMLYMNRMILPTHSSYQVFTADPLVRAKVDTVSQFFGSSNRHLVIL